MNNKTNKNNIKKLQVYLKLAKNKETENGRIIICNNSRDSFDGDNHRSMVKP